MGQTAKVPCPLLNKRSITDGTSNNPPLDFDDFFSNNQNIGFPFPPAINLYAYLTVGGIRGLRSYHCAASHSDLPPRTARYTPEYFFRILRHHTRIEVWVNPVRHKPDLGDTATQFFVKLPNVQYHLNLCSVLDRSRIFFFGDRSVWGLFNEVSHHL